MAPKIDRWLEGRLVFKRTRINPPQKDINKAELHIDKAFSPTSKSTAPYLSKKETETRIKCIHWMKYLTSTNTLQSFRFIKTSFQKTARKNVEWTLENGSRGMV
ncbi:hypothetical protein TNCV_2109431 [Trichonephila clavipes]|nr:hypothetical protein TNCV_2109431 [Trichonephila clavipes]